MARGLRRLSSRAEAEARAQGGGLRLIWGFKGLSREGRGCGLLFALMLVGGLADCVCGCRYYVDYICAKYFWSCLIVWIVGFANNH